MLIRRHAEDWFNHAIRATERYRGIAAAGMAVVLAALWCAVVLHSDFSEDDAEPEILNQAWRWLHHEPLYRGTEQPPYVFAAYPPIYYVVVGSLLRLSGLSYLPAQVVSLLSAGAILVCLYLFSRRNAESESWPLALLFLTPAFFISAFRCHPQMFATACTIWSAYLFVSARPPLSLILSPLLAALAIYTKQSQIALPLAAMGYLALTSYKRLLIYTSVFGLATGIPFVWLQWTTHGYFFYDIVTLAALQYSFAQIPLWLYKLLGPLVVFLIWACLRATRTLLSRTWGFLDVYFTIVVVLSVVSIGRVGSDSQYVLELVVLIFLYLQPIFFRPASGFQRFAVATQLVVLILGAPWFIGKRVPREVRAYHGWQEVAPDLSHSRGVILSQRNTMPLFVNGSIYVQLFHFMALSRKGMWNQQLLVKDVEGHLFGRVVTKFPVGTGGRNDADQERFTPELIAALRSNYRLDRIVDIYYVYRPNEDAVTVPAPASLSRPP